MRNRVEETQDWGGKRKGQEGDLALWGWHEMGGGQE
jgi:hypothetical protein